MAKVPEASLLVLGLCAVAVGTWIINEATRKTTASPAPASSLQSPPKPVERLEQDERAAFDWFNRMLVEGGRLPVSDQATIADSDLRRFVRAVRDKQDVTDAALMSWRIAANKRSRAAGQQIDDDIEAGRTPAYPVLTGEGLPQAARPYDLVSVHRPEGSAQRYVIALPEELFPAETAKVREVRAGVLAFFEQSLRPLFAAPATTPR